MADDLLEEVRTLKAKLAAVADENEARGHQIHATFKVLGIEFPDMDFSKLAEVVKERVGWSERLYEALRWLVYLAHDVGKAGGPPEPGEWEAATEAGEKAFARGAP